MAKTQNKYTYEQIIKDLSEKKYFPLYLLCGEEPYYIDKISDFIEKNVLTEEEKEMNLTVLYGKDSKIGDVLSAIRKFPINSNYQVVIVKEAQGLARSLDKLEFYAQNPPKSTIFVLCYKNGKPDGRKKYVKSFNEKGILFDSGTIYDNQVPKFVKDICKEKNIKIEEKAVNMLSEFIGTNLSAIVNEIDKLLIIKPQSEDMITADLVAKNVGISKNYNVLELMSALGERNVLLSNRIINHLSNSKESKMPQALSTLNNFFLSVFFYQQMTTKEHIPADYAIQKLGIHPFYFKNQYLPAVRNYSSDKIRNIISEIRKADGRCKGFGGTFPDEDIWKELVFRILH